jgi:hypothetical protein
MWFETLQEVFLHKKGMHLISLILFTRSSQRYLYVSLITKATQTYLEGSSLLYGFLTARPF